MPSLTNVNRRMNSMYVKIFVARLKLSNRGYMCCDFLTILTLVETPEIWGEDGTMFLKFGV
jgi:hypothetical protein